MIGVFRRSTLTQCHYRKPSFDPPGFRGGAIRFTIETIRLLLTGNNWLLVALWETKIES